MFDNYFCLHTYFPSFIGLVIVFDGQVFTGNVGETTRPIHMEEPHITSRLLVEVTMAIIRVEKYLGWKVGNKAMQMWTGGDVMQQ